MSANTCGGVCGKMISPQSISVATGSTGLVGHEADIFRFTFKHSILLAAIIGGMHLLWAYVFPGMVPSYQKLVVAVPAASVPAAAAINPEGLMYLGVCISVIFIVTVVARVLGKDLVVVEAREGRIHFH
jgi:lactate permease